MKTSKLRLKSTKNIDAEKIKYYCAFSYLTSIKPLFKAKLLEYFDYDITRAFWADEKEVAHMCAINDITLPKGYFAKKNQLNPIECYKNAFLDPDVKIVTYEDKNYPPYLREIPDYPLALYYKGNLEKITYRHPIAIVGSRRATQEAKRVIRSLISSFRYTDLNVVSGLACGIDAQAHQSAIDNNLQTIAVIGSGLDYQYPSVNKFLYKHIIAKDGVIFTEYPLKTPPIAANFPQRNRIVVGISKGTLVGEAQMHSGAMISANLTLDYNRELMCVPGNVSNPNTQGIYHLIKNGAGIVVNAKDLLNIMNWSIIINKDEELPQLNTLQQAVMKCLELEPKTFDEIVLETKAQVSSLMVALTELELGSLIIQSHNKYYKQ